MKTFHEVKADRPLYVRIVVVVEYYYFLIIIIDVVRRDDAVRLALAPCIFSIKPLVSP